MMLNLHCLDGSIFKRRNKTRQNRRETIIVVMMIMKMIMICSLDTGYDGLLSVHHSISVLV
jgi:hypothetical protein